MMRRLRSKGDSTRRSSRCFLTRLVLVMQEAMRQRFVFHAREERGGIKMARRGRGRPRDASLEFHWLGEWGGGGGVGRRRPRRRRRFKKQKNPPPNRKATHRGARSGSHRRDQLADAWRSSTGCSNRGRERREREKRRAFLFSKSRDKPFVLFTFDFLKNS